MCIFGYTLVFNISFMSELLFFFLFCFVCYGLRWLNVKFLRDNYDLWQRFSIFEKIPELNLIYCNKTYSSLQSMTFIVFIRPLGLVELKNCIFIMERVSLWSTRALEFFHLISMKNCEKSTNPQTHNRITNNK